ncbi:hypothetical protein CFter6_0231 [Collimonas fungivorans]|uniref:Uncharacterized protein n=1 Tax=Collimonas fungivorans TaxID=158899 RepID=A0A127P571_9BURK|nr:hypothetical protein [Collimonas fungivorans]AMO92962.1 hypothetical protein CFter6_0231 [Collimonas fungivorans]
MTARLKATIAAIVTRYRNADALLTWSLMHQIENEAIAALAQLEDFELAQINMLRAYPVAYPRTDDPVNFGNANRVPVVLSLIYNEYRRSH